MIAFAALSLDIHLSQAFKKSLLSKNMIAMQVLVVAMCSILGFGIGIFQDKSRGILLFIVHYRDFIPCTPVLQELLSISQSFTVVAYVFLLSHFSSF